MVTTLERPPEVDGVTCQGCEIPLVRNESMIHLDRHVAEVSPDGQRSRPQSVTVLLRLCLPCAEKNLSRIEQAVADALKAIRRENGLA